MFSTFRNATLAAVILASGALASAASATTITFSGLAGANGTPVATYTEGGFTVTTIVGQFFQGQVFGNPVPSLFAGPVQGGPRNNTLDVKMNGGGLFNFSSFDLAANNGNVNFSLMGFLGGVLQYAVNGVEPGRFGPFGFDTILNSSAAVAIDDLRIALNILGSSGNVDNIVVSAVPLPAALPLFAGVLGGMGFLGWRRKRKAAALAAA
jgi:hypothetical protein